MHSLTRSSLQSWDNMDRVCWELFGGVRTSGIILFSLQNSGSYLKLHLCWYFKLFLFLNVTRHDGHWLVSVSDWQEDSESVSEEEKSELFGVRVAVGDTKGELGDESGEVAKSFSEEVLDAEVFLLLLLGLSGVRNVESNWGGGQDWGRITDSWIEGTGKLIGETVLPRFSNSRCLSCSWRLRLYSWQNLLKHPGYRHCKRSRFKASWVGIKFSVSRVTSAVWPGNNAQLLDSWRFLECSAVNQTRQPWFLHWSFWFFSFLGVSRGMFFGGSCSGWCFGTPLPAMSWRRRSS